MTVRQARADEIEKMQALERDAARTYALLPETAFCLELPVRDLAEHDRARKTGIALVTEWNGNLVGFILGLPVDGRAHVLEVAVGQVHQGIGHGRRLISAFEDWAGASGFAEATLTTLRDVPWNAPFYARLGYRPFDIGNDRPELRAIWVEEGAIGLDRAPRAAMRKSCVSQR